MSHWCLFGQLKQFSCLIKHPNQDPLVSVANKFSLIVPVHFIGEDQFVTCNSHKHQMEKQARLFSELLHNNYWKYLSANKMLDLSLYTQVKDSVKLGIPPELRGKMWQTLAGVTITPEFIARYHELTKNKNEQYAGAIANDLDRTTFDIEDPSFNEKLFNVLIAYANHNPVVGYCQSMNILAATLLIFMPEQEAFWMLVFIIEKLLPNFHCESMPGYHYAELLFKFLLASFLPELYAHFQKIHFDIAMFTSKWFFSLYMNAMPNVTTFVVWDNIMLRGKNAIFEAGLSILRMQQSELLQINDDTDVMIHICEHLKRLYNPQKLQKHWWPLHPEHIKLAEESILRMEGEMQQAEIASRNRGIKTNELKNLWIQYTTSPFLSRYTNSMPFSQFVEQTFN